MHIPLSATSIFLAARSLCTKHFLDKYSIPEAIWRQKLSRILGTVVSTSSPGLIDEKYMVRLTTQWYTTSYINTYTGFMFSRYPFKSPFNTSSRIIIVCMNEIVNNATYRERCLLLHLAVCNINTFTHWFSNSHYSI